MKLSRESKTGIIVVGGILLFIMGFSYLKATPVFDNSRKFYVVYDHVGGLQTGTQVSINGYAVGKVVDIRFKDQSGKLLVHFSVSNDFQFSRNSKAELFDTGIIGGKGIQIQPVFDDAPMAQDGDTLASSIRPGITELVQDKLTPLQLKVEDAVANADSLLVHVNDVLNPETRTNLREAIEGMNKLVASFQESAKGINGLLSRNQAQMDSTLGNIATITGNFARISDTLAAAGLGETMAQLEVTVTNMNALLNKMEQGQGTMGRLMQDESLYENLANATRQLDLLLQDFRLNPKRYVHVSMFGRKQKEYSLPQDDPAETPDPQ